MLIEAKFGADVSTPRLRSMYFNKTKWILAVISVLAVLCSPLAIADTRLKITLIMWSGYSPNFEGLSDSKKIVFKKEVAVPDSDLILYPEYLLKKHLEEGALKKNFSSYWLGVVCRPNADGKSGEVRHRGRISKFDLHNAKSGDVIVFYRERY